MFSLKVCLGLRLQRRGWNTVTLHLPLLGAPPLNAYTFERVSTAVTLGYCHAPAIRTERDAKNKALRAFPWQLDGIKNASKLARILGGGSDSREGLAPESRQKRDA